MFGFLPSGFPLPVKNKTTSFRKFPPSTVDLNYFFSVLPYNLPQVSHDRGGAVRTGGEVGMLIHMKKTSIPKEQQTKDRNRIYTLKTCANKWKRFF